jgi:hypothetical protein
VHGPEKRKEYVPSNPVIFEADSSSTLQKTTCGAGRGARCDPIAESVMSKFKLAWGGRGSVTVWQATEIAIVARTATARGARTMSGSLYSIVKFASRAALKFAH